MDGIMAGPAPPQVERQVETSLTQGLIHVWNHTPGRGEGRAGREPASIPPPYRRRA